MNRFIAAISFLTIIPVKHLRSRLITEDQFNTSAVYFPLVGLLIGMLSSTTYYVTHIFSSNSTITATVVVFIEILLTRGFHVDGFSDFVDGIFGGHDKESRLNIMKDPHIGVFGVIAIVFLVLLKIEMISIIPVSIIYVSLVIMPLLSRWIILYPMRNVPYATVTGIGKSFRITRFRFAMATIFTIAVVTLLLQTLGILILMIVSAVSFAIILIAKKTIGGMTGDVYGFLIESCELAFLLFCIVLLHILSVSILLPW